MSKEYIQIDFDFNNQEQFDMLVAELADLGFEGFNEEELEQRQNDGFNYERLFNDVIVGRYNPRSVIRACNYCTSRVDIATQ